MSRCRGCGSGTPRNKYLLIDDELFWEWFRFEQYDQFSAIAFSYVQDGGGIDIDYVLGMRMNIPIYFVLNISEIPKEDLEHNFQVFTPYQSKCTMKYLKINHSSDKYKMILMTDRYDIIKKDKEWLEKQRQ